MNNIFLGLLVVTPLAALVFFFSLIGNERVVNEQRVEKAEIKLENQKFDDEFSDAWNGEPGSKIKKQRAENIGKLKAEVEKASAKRDKLDGFLDKGIDDMNSAITEANAELEKNVRPDSSKSKSDKTAKTEVQQ